jgi:hypothetical protein
VRERLEIWICGSSRKTSLPPRQLFQTCPRTLQGSFLPSVGPGELLYELLQEREVPATPVNHTLIRAIDFEGIGSLPDGPVSNVFSPLHLGFPFGQKSERRRKNVKAVSGMAAVVFQITKRHVLQLEFDIGTPPWCALQAPREREEGHHGA